MTAGTLGGATGLTLLAGCLVDVAAEVLPGVGDLSEPGNGLISDAVEGTEAGARAGVSEPDRVSLPSADAEPLLDDAEK